MPHAGTIPLGGFVIHLCECWLKYDLPFLIALRAHTPDIVSRFHNNVFHLPLAFAIAGLSSLTAALSSKFSRGWAS